MVRSEPILFGIFCLGMLYVFPIPSVNMTIPEILRLCSLSSVFGPPSSSCGFFSNDFYGIWLASIFFILWGIFSKKEEKIVEKTQISPLKEDIPIKHVPSKKIPIKIKERKPIFAPFLQKMIERTNDLIFEKDEPK